MKKGAVFLVVLVCLAYVVYAIPAPPPAPDLSMGSDAGSNDSSPPPDNIASPPDNTPPPDANTPPDNSAIPAETASADQGASQTKMVPSPAYVPPAKPSSSSVQLIAMGLLGAFFVAGIVMYLLRKSHDKKKENEFFPGQSAKSPYLSQQASAPVVQPQSPVVSEPAAQPQNQVLLVMANYMRSNLQKGYSLDQIKATLNKQGYSDDAIRQAYAMAK
jgi:hypothetical protein